MVDISIIVIGFNLLVFGGINFLVDGVVVDVVEKVVFKGFLFSDVFNFVGLYGCIWVYYLLFVVVCSYVDLVVVGC